MPRPLTSGIVAVTALALFPGFAAACVEPFLKSQEYAVIGEAFDNDGELLYTETLIHRADDTGGSLETRYRLPQGVEIARKTVEYDCRPTAPSFELQETTSGQLEGARWVGDRIEVFSGDELTSLEVPEGPLIFDAGFDNSIKLNWDRLMDGETLTVNYLFSRAGRFLELRLQQSEAPDNATGVTTDGVVYFRISANNPFLRLFSSSLFVGYDREDRSLRYYSGPSNLPMMRDQKQVLIRYRDLESDLADATEGSKPNG